MTTIAVGYAAMIVAAILLFLWIRRLGRALPAATASGDHPFAPGRSSHTPDVLLHVLLALAVIIVAARLVGSVFRRLRQPPVIGEVLAGILLGPSLLGRVWPDAYGFLLPASVAPFLQVIAQVGVILYMFLVGLELDSTSIRKSPQTALAISHASIVVPFLLGSALALGLYPRLASRDVPFTAFALFLGVSMSVTAFPVLARILTERRLQRTDLGVMALTCAAVDDVTAWCLLAFLVSVVEARGQDVVRTVTLTAAFIAFVFLALRPVLARLAHHVEQASEGVSIDVMALVCVLLLGSALATESIGIHALFGSFLLGAVIPHESRLARDLTVKLHDVVVVLLLPAFFAFSGMRTQIQLVDGVEQWLLCGLVILVACAGKFGGTAVAARLSGLSWNQASALGILMNTRGLVELIVLNLGLDLGVISPTLFAMLVIMALATTFATAPILDGILSGARRAERLSSQAVSSSVAPQE
jgi:Kef-type K+ transport system membrane component KefB